MKIIFGLIILAINFSSLAQSFKLEGDNLLLPTNVMVAWGTVVTNLPDEAWVYRVVPQSFSDAVLTNLLSICDLHTFNRKNHLESKYLEFDKNFMEFDQKYKTLMIAPTVGWMHYEDAHYDTNINFQTAPSRLEAIKLADDLAFQLGIDKSLINPIPDRMSETSNQTGNNPAVIIDRGAMLHRKIDGIEEKGFCLYSVFGTDKGQPVLKQFKLFYRNLEPCKKVSIADTNQIAEFIRQGKSTYTFLPDNLPAIKKLVITKFYILYWSKPIMPNDSLDFEFPYADITAEAYSDNATNTLYLYCPLLK
ncbi:MAG TPA: hypothetical protein VHG71_07205 [Verrucomicrobiae bacterium]|nr:hypothetical protein [Verrucomicrobiae bacterium]